MNNKMDTQIFECCFVVLYKELECLTYQQKFHFQSNVFHHSIKILLHDYTIDLNQFQKTNNS
jgi:hypothetical protein